jgi:hypothetical protein
MTCCKTPFPRENEPWAGIMLRCVAGWLSAASDGILFTEVAKVKDPRQEERALRQREANAHAVENGEPLPFPNMWDAIDPTKVDRDSTPAQVQASYRRFAELCRPRPRKQHRL